MDETDNEIYNGNKKNQELSIDIGISEFMELPEFRFWPHPKNRRSTRVYRMLYTAKEMGMQTLKELKEYIEEHGWKRKSYSSTTRFRQFGEESIEYFNTILKKYGIEPLGPMYKSK